MDMQFQFTHPGRGATASIPVEDIQVYVFQFTHPGRGATTAPDSVRSLLGRFNSRTPGGVRHDIIL